MPNWNKAPKIQRSSCASRRHCERWFWMDLMQYLPSKDHQHHKWRQQRSWISYPHCQDAQYKQLTQCLLIPRTERKMLQNYWKLPNRNVQTYGFVYHDTNGQNHWSSMEDPVVPLERNLYGHPLAGLLWERQFEKILLKHGWEKIPNWECLFVHREKGLYSSVFVDDIKLVGKKQNINPMWKVRNKEVDMGEPTSFFDHVYLGCIQRQCEISKDIVDNYRTMFESRISTGATEKLPCSGNLFVVLWHGGSCQEMCGTILWVGKQNESTTLQSVNSMPWRPSLQRRRIEIRGRIVKHMFSNCSEMLILGTYWTTRYSMVSEEICTIDYEMDQSLWQTPESLDLLHSLHKWIQTILSIGKHCKTVQIGSGSRLRLCRRSWGFKIDIRWNIVHFRKPHVCSN